MHLHPSVGMTQPRLTPPGGMPLNDKYVLNATELISIPQLPVSTKLSLEWTLMNTAQVVGLNPQLPPIWRNICFNLVMGPEYVLERT